MVYIEKDKFMSDIILILLISMTTLAVYSQSVHAEARFLVQPSGQANYHSCQSYALAVALAFKRDKAFKLDTAADLRKVETDIRAEIKKQAGNNEVNHTHVEKGFSAYTKGSYVLKIIDVTEPDMGEKMIQRSGIAYKNAVPPDFFLGVAVKDVALTSLISIGKNTYRSGHIVALLGVDGPPNSNRSYLVLNSGVKIKDTNKTTCEEGIPDDSGPYTAQVSWVPSTEIDFRRFGSKLKLWQVEKP